MWSTCLAVRLGMLFVPVFIVVTASAHAQTDAGTAELLAESDIIFTGTVREVASVSFDEVPASDNTVVADVSAVHLAPDVLTLIGGERITVALRESGSLQLGSRAVFFTTGWILGAGIAVKEIGHRILDGESDTDLSGVGLVLQQARDVAEDAVLVERLRVADAVVVGRVAEVQAATPASARGGILITEHDPEWREAVVVVESGLKGAVDGDEVVVRFPASRDVRWYASPKLAPGQEATFVLQQDAVSGTAVAIRGDAQVTAYTALAQQDVLPRGDADRIRELLVRTR